ncbi:MAG: site-specific integrase, partial [Candidatus Riflebacteria bacterium]
MMLPQEEQKLAILFDQMVKALKRQGMSERTIGAFSRMVFHLGRFFDKCPDKLEMKDLKKYFDHLISTLSWSTVRADRCAMQFFWKHVLNRNWKWMNDPICVFQLAENCCNRIRSTTGQGIFIRRLATIIPPALTTSET